MTVAYPDTLVGTDSHTTMINGLGVLGWGVGGIEAEAAMLGQPVSMLIPRVVGFKLSGEQPEGTTATDLVLTITEMLRKHGVVGKFVEFYGPGVAAVPLANRATIGNMSPEYGSTCAIFPIDDETLDLPAAHRPRRDARSSWSRPTPRSRACGTTRTHEPDYSERLELDLSTVEPSLAGPKRPQDRVPLQAAKDGFRAVLGDYARADNGNSATRLRRSPSRRATRRRSARRRQRRPTPEPRPASKPATSLDGETFEIDHGAVVIAAITSCTNTSNPFVMVGAGLLAKKAVERGLTRKPWVKTSLAPGSKVVSDYYDKAGLDAVPRQARLRPGRLRLHDLHRQLRPAHPGGQQGDQRQRPGCGLGAVRQPQLRGPDQPRREDELPRVAAAGRRLRPRRHDGHRPAHRPARHGHATATTSSSPTSGRRRRDPGRHQRHRRLRGLRLVLRRGLRRRRALAGPRRPDGRLFEWAESSTYVRRPPYFDGMPKDPAPITDITGARVLAVLGDSVTTDHISPAGNIKKDGPAGRYLSEHGVEPRDFNSYGSRRGNHEVMIRGTFANIRLRNQLAPGTEGGVTRHLPDGDRT